MRKTVWVARIIRVAHGITHIQLGGILENRGFQFPKLLEYKIALFPALHFHAVDGSARLDGGVVRGVEGFVEEGVKDRGLSTAGGANDIAVHDAALDFRLSPRAPPGLGDFQRGGDVGFIAGAGLEAEVREVLERCFWLLEGGHAPLREPALKANVAGFAADGAGGERGVDPARRQARGGSKQRCELLLVQAAVVVFVKEEEEVDEEAVADGGELGGRVFGDFKTRVEEGVR